ncbi:hypothetical protein HZY97_01445 [Sphingomonas sp. R-74633]|uniref:hypothetical protein n=1 Tax=Sphingomonas sp. R-74633 TaxID=2751188 RepID=UPI0015D28C4D|nr:hypothetical protein [Sphingomonas sp. R-74633]NYT39409.1 hypothetical protein [Sphingomonas sp. R-74633]
MTRDPAWLAALDAGALFFGLALALLLGWERARWRPMRRLLALAALQAHRDCGENVLALSREFFRENGAAPLERLIRARRAIEQQAADGARFGRMVSVYAPAVDARHAALLADTAGLVGQAEHTLAGLARLYLGQASVRVGSNAMHGDDALGYAPAQLVSLGYVAEMEALADGFAEASAAHRGRVEAALGRRARRAARADLERVDADVAMLGADVRRFCAKLQPADADCVGYKTRPHGERVSRTLDALIARFDRR